MEANRIKDFSVHTVNYVLSAISSSLQAIGKIQIDSTLTEEAKTAQLNMHQSFILNMCHLLAPFIDVAEELFPQYAPLLGWVKTTYSDAIDKQVVRACNCAGCVKPVAVEESAQQ